MTVPRNEWFRYGFSVFAYWLVLLVVGAALVGGGGWVISEQVGTIGANEDGALAAAGGFLAVLGLLVFGAGQAGLAYKVVADGVAAGVVARTGTPAPGSGTDPDPDDPGDAGDTGGESPRLRGATDPTADTADGTTGHTAASGPSTGGSDPSGTATASGGVAATEAGASRDRTDADPGDTGGVDTEPGSPETGETESERDERRPTPADDDVAESAERRPEGDAVAGDGEATASPAEVASETDMAEKLGFESDGDRDARDAPERRPESRRSVDGRGEDATAEGVEAGDTAATEEVPGSLTDMLAGDDGGDDGPRDGSSPGNDALRDGSSPGDDRDRPEWTTGDDHMGEERDDG